MRIFIIFFNVLNPVHYWLMFAVVTTLSSPAFPVFPTYRYLNPSFGTINAFLI